MAQDLGGVSGGEEDYLADVRLGLRCQPLNCDWIVIGVVSLNVAALDLTGL